MGQPINPFAQAPAPTPAPDPTVSAPVTAPAAMPPNSNPFAQGGPAIPPATAPAPVTISPTQNPVTVDPGAADAAAQFAAWQAAQAAAAAPAPTAPAVPPAPPGVDPAQWAAFQAQQQGMTQVAPAQPVATPVAPAPQALVPQFNAPPAAPVTATAPSDDPFDDPAPQRPRGPRLPDMFGRLIIIIPRHVEQVERKQNDGSFKKQPRMTADVVILDDPQGGFQPVAFGGAPEKLPPKPHDQLGQLPFRINGMYISAAGLISQTRDTLAARQAGGSNMSLGRLTVGEAKRQDESPPYLLAKATPEDRAKARAYIATIDPFA